MLENARNVALRQSLIIEYTSLEREREEGKLGIRNASQGRRCYHQALLVKYSTSIGFWSEKSSYKNTTWNNSFLLLQTRAKKGQCCGTQHLHILTEVREERKKVKIKL
jgi:hypothetical protein